MQFSLSGCFISYITIFEFVKLDSDEQAKRSNSGNEFERQIFTELEANPTIRSKN
jgi:hypothetical protein